MQMNGVKTYWINLHESLIGCRGSVDASMSILADTIDEGLEL